jgi:hypothetical protein
MADCSYHPGKEAVGACVSCGKMVCIACRTELQEKVYCQPCANKLFVHKDLVQPAKVETVVTAPTIQSVSGWWWLLPIFFLWLGGLIAWAVNKSKDPRKSKSMLVWGIVLTVIWMVLVVILVIVGLVLGVLAMDQ